MDYLTNKNGKEILIESESAKIKSNLFAEFRRIRKEKHMTQQELANVAGMNRVDVSRFESGNYNPSLDLMIRCATALDCNIRIEITPRKE